MEKRMEVLTVSTTTDGDVEIIQPDYLGIGDAVISIPVEQVDILITWLQEAKLVILEKAAQPVSRQARSATLG